MKKIKNISKKTKIITLIVVVIIVAGIIVAAVKGFDFDLKYNSAQIVELNLEKNFDKKDIENIAKEVMNGKKVMIQKVEVFEDTVSITAKEITEEEKSNLITKINEKYQIELSSDSIEIKDVAHIRVRDLVKRFITPFCIATAIILVYMLVRYKKLGIIKTICKTIGFNVLTQVVLMSIIAITRIPFGRLTIPMVLAVYLLSMTYLTNKYENKLKEVSE